MFRVFFIFFLILCFTLKKKNLISEIYKEFYMILYNIRGNLAAHGAFALTLSVNYI